jgi:hypothetical protein
MSIPFQERITKLRGLLDLVGGCYPRFLFAGPVKSWLPVFHFHQAREENLEPCLRYLAENGYRTVTSDAVEALVLRGIHPGPDRVLLCFDDAWASLWTMAAPLLRRYDMRAVTFAIPGRIQDRPEPRPTLADPDHDPEVDDSDQPCVSWSELRALQNSGTIDVQAHTWSHAMIFCDQKVIGFLHPASNVHPHELPLLLSGSQPRFLNTQDLGAPLHTQRSAMSDALGYDNPDARQACLEHVREQGGPAFFGRPDWEKNLRALCAAHPGRFETERQRDQRIFQDLLQAREVLNHKLGANTVHQMCFPWAIAGASARRLARQAGYTTAFSDRLFGSRAVRANDPPYALMRLRHEFIFCLPGTNRRRFWHVVRP